MARAAGASASEVAALAAPPGHGGEGVRGWCTLLVDETLIYVCSVCVCVCVV